MDKIITAYYHQFEADAIRFSLDSMFVIGEDWYNEDRADAIREICPTIHYPGMPDTAHKEAYYAILRYVYHDGSNFKCVNTPAYKFLAGPFATEEEAKAVAEEQFEEAKAWFHRFE